MLLKKYMKERDKNMENMIEVRNLRKCYKIPVRSKGMAATIKNLFHRKFNIYANLKNLDLIIKGKISIYAQLILNLRQI